MQADRARSKTTSGNENATPSGFQEWRGLGRVWRSALLLTWLSLGIAGCAADSSDSPQDPTGGFGGDTEQDADCCGEAQATGGSAQGGHPQGGGGTGGKASGGAGAGGSAKGGSSSGGSSTGGSPQAGAGGSSTGGSSTGGNSSGGTSSGGTSTGGSSVGGGAQGGSSTGGSSTGGSSVGGASTGGSGGSGDPIEQARQVCIDHINALRASKGLAPYQRWVDGESCADQQATYDEQKGMPHVAWNTNKFGCDGGLSQNECIGSGLSMNVACLDGMWAEKDAPGCSGCDQCATPTPNCPDCDYFGSQTGQECGHYVNMSAKTYTMAACGFSSLGGWAVVNFR